MIISRPEKKGGDRIVRRHYLFYGRVQGVGFRFTTYRKALELGLTGWVCNLPDGSVEACIQGKEELVERLLKELNRERFIRIESIRIEELSVLKGEKTFYMKN